MVSTVRAEPELHEVEEVRLTLPASVDYARVARLAVTGVASRMGFSYDEIEDLRIAVGELCSVLLDGTGEQLVFHCTLGIDQLAVEVSRIPAGGPVAVTDLSREILVAVVDEAEIDTVQAVVRFVKRRQG
ncbi:MAG: anti-sigma factor RsbW [Acidimicrobiales bacterium]|nr:anti-sigma factor RsbW [Acidimicrobiales bacterium]